MTNFTVYFSGTGSNKFDNFNKTYWNGELISTLASHNIGKEFSDWIIIDGPGSGNLQEDELWTKPGNYGLTGTIFGNGWEENVKHATNIMNGSFDWNREKLTKENYYLLKAAGLSIQDVEMTGSFWWRKYDYGNRKLTQIQLQEQIIKIFRKSGLIPQQVNMIGWSRGGISCHMLANMMLNDTVLKNVPVNIFTVDPVPGPLNFQDKRVILGENVEEYVAFYARDERSKGFSCVIPKTDQRTRIHIYPMAGRHATLVGNAALNGITGEKALYEPGLIVRHYAEKCLSRWGVELEDKLDLDHSDINQLLETIVRDSDRYTKMHDYSYTYLTEKTEKNERWVYYPNKSVGFSEVKMENFTPAAGLSSIINPDASYYIDIE